MFIESLQGSIGARVGFEDGSCRSHWLDALPRDILLTGQSKFLLRMKKLLLLAGFGILALTSVLVIRTLQFTSKQTYDAAPVQIDIDTDAAVARLHRHTLMSCWF